MNKATLIKIDEHIEENLFLEINGTVIVGFATYCPHEITIGRDYSVEFSCFQSGLCGFQESEAEEYCINQLSSKRDYFLRGKVKPDFYLEVGDGINIDTRDLLSDSPYLVGKFIELKADRLDVDILDSLST